MGVIQILDSDYFQDYPKYLSKIAPEFYDGTYYEEPEQIMGVIEEDMNNPNYNNYYNYNMKKVNFINPGIYINNNYQIGKLFQINLNELYCDLNLPINQDFYCIDCSNEQAMHVPLSFERKLNIISPFLKNTNCSIQNILKRVHIIKNSQDSNWKSLLNNGDNDVDYTGNKMNDIQRVVHYQGNLLFSKIINNSLNYNNYNLYSYCQNLHLVCKHWNEFILSNIIFGEIVVGSNDSSSSCSKVNELIIQLCIVKQKQSQNYKYASLKESFTIEIYKLLFSGYYPLQQFDLNPSFNQNYHFETTIFKPTSDNKLIP